MRQLGKIFTPLLVVASILSACGSTDPSVAITEATQLNGRVALGIASCNEDPVIELWEIDEEAQEITALAVRNSPNFSNDKDACQDGITHQVEGDFAGWTLIDETSGDELVIGDNR